MSRGSRFISRKRRATVLLRDGEKCRYCGRKVEVQAGAWRAGHFDRGVPRNVEIGLCDEAATIDHVDPEGGHGIENLVTCCAACNRTKGRAIWGIGPHPPLPDEMSILIFRAMHWPKQY